MRVILRRRSGGRRITETYAWPIHLRAGAAKTTFLAVGDPRTLRATTGTLRGRFVFTSHGRRSAVTRTVRR
jgi:hypothetical protein